MTEETKNANITEAAPLEGSAFGRVLGRLMEARGIPADEEHVAELAEKGGLVPEDLMARMAGETMEHVGGMGGVVDELDLNESEISALALSYALERECDLADLADQNPPRVARPEEIGEDYDGLTEEQRLKPLRCRAGAKTDSPCPRDATTWMHPEDRDYALCDEHAREVQLWRESNEWSVAEEVTRDWLRVARAWRFEELERLALHAHEDAKAGFLKAEARAEAAQEMADAPRESRRDKMAALTPEQDAESRRLMRRADELNNAYTVLQDNSVAKIPEENLRRTLATLADERDRANEESRRYMAEIGIRPE